VVAASENAEEFLGVSLKLILAAPIETLLEREVLAAVRSMTQLNELSVKKMMGEATSRAPIPFAPRGTPRLIIKSISAKQRPRRTKA
jgi:hypothetical protein